MNVSLTIVYNSPMNSKKLYEEIECFKVNVTDLGSSVLVYTSNIDKEDAKTVIGICKEYGNCQIRTSLGYPMKE